MWPSEFAGFAVHHAPALASTNDTALTLAARTLSPAVVIADEQTSGRGRGHNSWQSPAGNVCMSLLLPDGNGLPLSLWPLRAGIVVADALTPLLSMPVRLKWPNDIMVGDAKVGGILIETVSRRPAIVIGIGLNVQQVPPALQRSPIAALQAFSSEASLTAQLLIERLLRQWHQPIACVRTAWLARAYGLEQPLYLENQGAVQRGWFAGIDADGVLLLRCEDGQIQTCPTAKNLTFIKDMA